jgi:hypothetical protein
VLFFWALHLTDVVQTQLQTIKQESEQKRAVKRERALSSDAGTTHPSKARRGIGGEIVYLLDSDDEIGPVGASASRAMPNKAEEVEVLDLRD